MFTQVQAALTDVASSPWKLVKYLFNRKVMSALKVRDSVRLAAHERACVFGGLSHHAADV